MFEAIGDGVVWRGDGETLDVRAWGPDSFRVRSRLMGELLDTDYALLPPQQAEADVDLDTDVAVVRNGRIQAVLRSVRGMPGGDASPEPPRCELEFRTSAGRTRLPVTPIRHADGRPNCPTGGDNEVWSYGEDAYRILTSYLRLRERMRPYVREVMRQAHELGDPVMRPMFYGYPDDERSWTVEDQYLFGPDLLVAPVVEPGARERHVYLPRGGTWTELHSGGTFDGGQVVAALAPLTVIPVFARDASHPELVGTI